MPVALGSVHTSAIHGLPSTTASSQPYHTDSACGQARSRQAFCETCPAVPHDRMQQPQLLLQPHGKLEDVVSTHAALTDTQNTLSVYYLSTLHVLGHPMHMQKLSHTQQFAWPQMFKLKADSWPLPVSAHHVLLHSLLAQHMACQEMRAQDNLRWLSCLLMLSYHPATPRGDSWANCLHSARLDFAGRAASTMAAAAAAAGGGKFCIQGAAAAIAVRGAAAPALPPQLLAPLPHPPLLLLLRKVPYSMQLVVLPAASCTCWCTAVTPATPITNSWNAGHLASSSCTALSEASHCPSTPRPSAGSCNSAATVAGLSRAHRASNTIMASSMWPAAAAAAAAPAKASVVSCGAANKRRTVFECPPAAA